MTVLVSGENAVFDDAAVRLIGRGETNISGLSVLQRHQARHRLVLLELVARRAESERGATSTIAVLVRRWMSLVRSKSPQAAGLLVDPFVGIWAEGVMRGDRTLDEPGAVDRFLSPAVATNTPLTTVLPCTEGRVRLARCGGTAILDTAEAEVTLSEGSLRLAGARGVIEFDRSTPSGKASDLAT